MENKIIVFKGFSEEFMEDVYSRYPKISEETDLIKLAVDSKRICKNFLSYSSGVYAGTFEQLLAIEPILSMYEGKVEIICNNLYSSKYPYDFSNMENQVRDFIKLLEGELFSEEESVLEKYFGNIEELDGNFYVTFKELGENSISSLEIEIKDYYTAETFDLDIKEYNLETAEGIISLSNEPSFLTNLAELENSFSKKEFNLLVEEGEDLKKVYPIAELCRKKEIELNIFIEKLSSEYIPRKELAEILRKYWQSESFREMNFYKKPEESKEIIKKSQGEIIEEIVVQAEKGLSENNQNIRDMFITAPTGSGKSVLFQIPAIYLFEKYKALTIIVSPLKALMKDQVESLAKRGVNIACYLNSDQSYQEREEIVGKIKNEEIGLIYLSPELLLANGSIEKLIGERKIGSFIVDEAHTVTTWGRNFRVDYWMLGIYLEKLRNQKRVQEQKKSNFPVVATTATAIYGGISDTVFAIQESLKLKNCSKSTYIGQVTKSNICFDIRKLETGKSKYKGAKEAKFNSFIIERVKNKTKTIIYFPYAKQIQEIYAAFPDEIRDQVSCYFSELDYSKKIEFEKKFRSGEKTIMLATKAFGMGIDIDDIESVYHFAPSGDLADYVQEIGRAARKTEMSGIAEIDYNPQDFSFKRKLSYISGVKQWQTKMVIGKLYDLYKMNQGRRNMLVDVESFSYIFSESSENTLEQKVKLALISIEKDFYNKNSVYQTVIVRPKTIFSKGYIKISGDAEAVREKLKKDGALNSETENVLEIDLEKFWEKNYSELSFPKFMYKYYQGEIFSAAIKPQKHLKISLAKDLDTIKSVLSGNLDTIFDIFEEFGDRGFFTREELEKELMTEFGNGEKVEKISRLFLNMYTAYDHKNGENSQNKFLKSRKEQKREGNGKESIVEKFAIANSRMGKIKSDFKRYFHDLMQNMDKDGNYSRFVDMDYEGTDVANVLEALSLGNYSIKGGNTPKLFVRINDPLKLIAAVKNKNYENSILKEMEKTDKIGEKVLMKFFDSDMDNEVRWEYIENFFLGREVV